MKLPDKCPECGDCYDLSTVKVRAAPNDVHREEWYMLREYECGLSLSIYMEEGGSKRTCLTRCMSCPDAIDQWLGEDNETA